MTTINNSNYQPLQYNVLVGSTSGAIANIPPSSITGIPLVSNGATAQPAFSTAAVSGGGTGVVSFVPYTVLCGGTVSTGNLQTVSGLGNTGQVLTSNGSGTLPSWQNLSFSNFQVAAQVFTSGTSIYTPTSGMVYCSIECVGGGGGGGGTGTSGGGGGGGGGGGYAKKTVTAATIGTAQLVTVGRGGSAGPGANGASGNAGTGGTSSVGSIVSATGGAGGAGGVDGTSQLGGLGGVGVSGDINSAGLPGRSGYRTTPQPQRMQGGDGGNSIFGGAAQGNGGFSVQGPGVTASNYGGGGSGGFSITVSQVGAAGSNGIVIFTEFIL